MLLERWQTYWNWLFYGLLAVSTGVATADATGLGRRVAIVGLAAGLAVWYWRAVARDGRFGLGAGSALPSLAMGAALWAPLLLLHWLFQLLMFSAYQLACSAPVPVRRAIPAIAVVSAIVVATESVRRGGLDPLQLVFYGAVTLALGLFVAMTNAISEQSEERKRLIGELEATRQELAESERRAGALGERQRLAREIHDTLAQGFASIVTLCEAARAELPSRRDAVVVRRLDEVGRTARESLDEARRMVWALQPEALENGTLAGALADLANGFRSETGVDAESAVSGEPRDLGPEIDATLLRVAQEALANVRKHARATRVAVTLTFLDDAVLLDVRDDGIGFEPESGARRRNGWRHGGFGLTGMRERLEQHGGTLTIESAAGVGATIVATLPTPGAPSASQGATPS